jgi:hypothetical protein
LWIAPKLAAVAFLARLATFPAYVLVRRRRGRGVIRKVFLGGTGTLVFAYDIRDEETIDQPRPDMNGINLATVLVLLKLLATGEVLAHSLTAIWVVP